MEVAAEGLHDLLGLVLAQEPWSTKTHVSWSPTALCTRSAATAESTPPESAQSTRSEPTAARIRATCSSMTAAGVHVGGVPATS